jgi:hypothetical protein
MEKSLQPNPLSKFFRQPAIYLKLPSKGKYWVDGALDLPVNGEIPIYPMTARDEITLRTPDALMNGSSIVNVIQSCCPSVVDAWKTPSVDVDAMLIAIRIASYGHEMDVDTDCPNCKEENNNQVDLRVILANIGMPNFDGKVDIGDGLKVKLKPQAFFGVNKQNMVNFEEQKIASSLADSSLSDQDKATVIQNSVNKIIDMGIEVVTESTEYIEMDDGTIVNNKAHISDFYRNSNASIMKQIQDTFLQFNQDASIKPQRVKCGHCETEYQVPLEFDYSNFFGQGS